MPDLGNLFRFPRIASGILACALAFGLSARGADIAVEARLSRDATTLAQPVQYQIKISGARKLGEPPDIAADGLGIKFVGKSTGSNVRIDASGMHTDNTTTYVYTVQPEQHGTFTIPSVQVEADGQQFKTRPVALSVQQNADATDAPQAKGFAEIWLPKKAAYLGETLPMEFRLYVDARMHWQPAEMPQISGDGFTSQKMPEPRLAESAVREGRNYDMLVFKTAITPSRAGKIAIGPVKVPYNVQVPRPRRSGPRSFFDLLDENTFGDPFFSATQQLTAQAEPVELLVKPLPAAGKPANFSGAVGNFEISAEGNPKRVKVGDPITMKVRVAGHGDFSRVTAPVLLNPDGWRAYPPSNSFQPDASDPTGINGGKTFEMAVIPEAKKAEMPSFQLTYFDPLAEKYVTKTTEPAALAVEGVNSAPGPGAPAPSVAASGTPAPSKHSAPPADILGLRYDAPRGRKTFEPIYERKEFLFAQGIPLAALLAFLGWRLRPSSDGASRRASALRREKAELLAKLRSEDLPHSEFFDRAARVVQIDTALATGRESAAVDAAAARSSGGVDSETEEMIDQIFKTRSELLYAGAGASEGGVSGAERQRVLAALDNFGRSHARR